MALSYSRRTRNNAFKTGFPPFFFRLLQRLLLPGCILLPGIFIPAIAQENILQQQVTVESPRLALYDALGLITEKTGCLFVYDSRVVNNSKKVRLNARHQPLEKLLDDLFDNPRLQYRVIGRHILVYEPGKEKPPGPQIPEAKTNDTIQPIVIRGKVLDEGSGEPIPYVSVGVEGRPLGTITNTDGDFLLRAPAPAGDASIRISHIGFNSRTFPARLLGGQPVSLYLTRRIISIQEVIIRYMDPNIIISRALEQRKLNYSLQPVYQTAFYREGVTRNRNYTSYAEAVFRIYKSPFAAGGHGDQIKLLKSRKIQDASPRDTVFVKLKAGVLSALELDLVKYVPDFLDDDRLSRYDFTYTNLVSYDDRTAYAIDFVQKAEVNEPLFMGTIYVDQESYAILGAEFRVNPRHLEQAAENLVFRKSRRLNVKFEQISYSVNYTPVNGKYMLNHARCDMVIRTKLRGRLTSDNFTTFLELASCATDTASVQKFDRQEVLPPSIVFSDADLKYDESFWGEYNIIVPEERLNVTLSRIRARIEEIR